MIGLVAAERLGKLGGNGGLAASGVAPQRAWVIFDAASSDPRCEAAVAGVGFEEAQRQAAADELLVAAELGGRSGRDRVWMRLDLSDALPAQARRAWQRVCSRSMAAVG